MIKWVLVLAVVLNCSLRADVLFTETFDQGLTKRWAPREFEGTTTYQVVTEGENKVLRAVANQAASGLGAELSLKPGGKMTLSWRWKIDQIPPGGTDQKIESFDHTARLFVAFNTLIGPPRTINYVWANNVKKGARYDHPSSSRAKFIVLQAGNEKAGEWVSEERDLLADWRTLFGNGKIPEIVAIGLMTDSDGTRSKVTGFYDDISLRRE
jgi:hypothetical protein